MTGSEKYVTTAALAAHFGVSAATIITMVRAGDIPTGTYTRMGRVFRFDLNRVETALLEREKNQPADAQMEFDFNPDSDDEPEHTETENDNG
jgi:hypothetical protein